nr:UDP-galactose transporter 2 [Tanacetum cinerariifolium]
MYLDGTTGNSGSARDVPDKDEIVEDASEIEQIGVIGAVETANFGEASIQTNVNGMEHEKLSSSSLLTWSSWSELSLKMKEVGADGTKLLLKKSKKKSKNDEAKANVSSVTPIFPPPATRKAHPLRDNRVMHATHPLRENRCDSKLLEEMKDTTSKSKWLYMIERFSRKCGKGLKEKGLDIVGGRQIVVMVVVIGVGVCTVTDVKDNVKGFIWACLAVLETSLQQIKKSTLKSVMDLLSDYTQFTFEQSTMLNKLPKIMTLILGRMTRCLLSHLQ